VELVELLNAELASRDGQDHAFYNQFNGLEGLTHVVVMYDGEVPIGCGAMKPFGTDALEIKRMFTLPGYRGRGVAGAVLKDLEQWAASDAYSRCVLETGKRQPEAIALYDKYGYRRISNFEPYTGVENSVCFEKVLDPGRH
jgi:GNAT superfamily N-acetyltransferase